MGGQEKLWREVYVHVYRVYMYMHVHMYIIIKKLYYGM